MPEYSNRFIPKPDDTDFGSIAKLSASARLKTQQKPTKHKDKLNISPYGIPFNFVLASSISPRIALAFVFWASPGLLVGGFWIKFYWPNKWDLHWDSIRSNCTPDLAGFLLVDLRPLVDLFNWHVGALAGIYWRPIANLLDIGCDPTWEEPNLHSQLSQNIHNQMQKQKHKDVYSIAISEFFSGLCQLQLPFPLFSLSLVLGSLIIC